MWAEGSRKNVTGAVWIHTNYLHLAKFLEVRFFKGVKESSNLIVLGQVGRENMYRERLSKERFSVFLKPLS